MDEVIPMKKKRYVFIPSYDYDGYGQPYLTFSSGLSLKELNNRFVEYFGKKVLTSNPSLEILEVTEIDSFNLDKISDMLLLKRKSKN
jgi:hypothetical protein